MMSVAHRADRAARFQKEKADRDEAVASKQQAKQTASSEARTKHEAARRYFSCPQLQDLISGCKLK